jgi:nicotinate-nucleotide pyrophosphorylase (carboxylating)
MLDNFSKDDLIIAIKKIRNSSSSIKIEVSGGVNIENIANYADLDIDFISIGSLTNEIKIVDIGLDFI